MRKRHGLRTGRPVVQLWAICDPAAHANWLCSLRPNRSSDPVVFITLLFAVCSSHVCRGGVEWSGPLGGRREGRGLKVQGCSARSVGVYVQVASRRVASRRVVVVSCRVVRRVVRRFVRRVVRRFVVSCPVLSCPFVRCPVPSRPVPSRPVPSCRPVLSCRVVSCVVSCRSSCRS